jgi:membrane protein DedA with SNARE-associated domain
MGIVEDFVSILTGVAGDPILYSVVFFVYAVLAAIILPIPVEFGLILSPHTPWYVLAIVLGAGKAVGSVLVFRIGMEIEGPVRRWSKRVQWFGKFIELCERFVARYGYYALYVLLSIPFMSDTAVLYIFSIVNKDGEAMTLKWFAVVNFLAGVTRAIFLVTLLYIFNVNLFN